MNSGPSLQSFGVKPDDAKSHALWSGVGAGWLESRFDLLWRAYSDSATSSLLSAWIPDGQRAVLKTDLFDEAVSDGLYPKLQELSGRVHGIDVATPLVEAVASKYPRMRAQMADIRELPFDDAHFDCVVSTSTLDHFHDEAEIHKSLREIRRVTTDAGLLLITLDNPMNPKLALRSRMPEQLLTNIGLVPYPCGATLSPKALETALDDARYEVIATKPFLHCPRVSAVRLARVVQKVSSSKLENSFKGFLRGFEHLERLPTRWRTAHYTAVLARAI